MVNVAIDIETTGLVKGYHEICQLAVVVLDEGFGPVGDKFVSYIKPFRFENADPKALEINGLSKEKLLSSPSPMTVRSAFINWKEELYPGELLRPLTHNGLFDLGFLEIFLGDMYSKVFDYHVVDTFAVANYFKDKKRFPTSLSCSLNSLKEYFMVKIGPAHDAYMDALATAAVYRALLRQM